MKNRLLIIDDSPNDIKILSNALHDEYAVSVATGGAEGLTLAAEQMPDLILLDIIMPEIDGFKVIESLQNNPATKDIPVIFLTVVDAVTDKVRGFACGAVDYIIKPFEMLEVKARVQTHLRLREAQRQMAAQNKELLEVAQLRDGVERIYRHDLKNPLTAVLGNSELLLLADDLSGEQRSKLEAIHQAGLAMLNMINRYFDLFKIEQGMYTPRKDAVDLGRIVKRVLADLDNMIRARKLSVDFDPGDQKEGGIIASGEDMLCYSMTANLVKNAVEASKPGDQIRIAVHQGAMAELTIENPGEVPEEIRPRFFDKYVTYGKKQGTGLGTYSARLLAELQKGKIELDTSKTGHTRVNIALPAWH